MQHCSPFVRSGSPKPSCGIHFSRHVLRILLKVEHIASNCTPATSSFSCETSWLPLRLFKKNDILFLVHFNIIGSSDIYFSNIDYNQLCCSYFLVNFFLFILPLIYKLVTLLVHKRRSESMGIYLYLQYYLFIQFIVLIGYRCSE